MPAIMYIVSLFFLCMVHEVFNLEDHELCKHTTCHECITDPVKCVWCSTDNFDLDQRCKPAGLNKVDWCKEVGAIEEANNEIDIIDDHNFTSDDGNVVQIKPQRIKMKLRVGEPATFKFQYKAAENYPVDLYFLFDASSTMRTIRNETIMKSQEIYSALFNLTNRVYIGLGTFIDKSMIPYNRNLTKICYSFKHTLNLTSNVTTFKEVLNKTKLGFNYDFPEGGFDGLAQIMACKETIVWRNQSRKLIILITDDNFHSAGDGKFSGIFKPYDGGCYLDSNGLYYNEKHMDYPSVGIISKLAADRQFTIIFAKTFNKTKQKETNEKNPYPIISDGIQGARYSFFDTDTISNTLKEIYQTISQNIKLDVNIAVEDQKYFEIKFNPDCRKNNTNCTVVTDEEKTIDGTITLQEYYGKNHINITVVQQGLQEHLLLDIDIISSCKCQGENKTKYNSTECSKAGDRQCGICSCNTGRSGPTCECSDNKDMASNATCIKDDVLCSQHGDCNCGVCVCHPGFDGHYCEFRSDSCKRDSYGALCSGHGKCRNGTCKCTSDWEGEVCGCLNSKMPCRDTDGIECNNRGHCYCGRCKCDKLPKWDVRHYTDEYCSQEPCEDCHRRQCRELVSCYNCQGSSDCSEECGGGITAVNVAEDINGNWRVCNNVRVGFGCYSNFGYTYNDEAREIILYVYSKPTCMESYYIYAGVSLGALLLVGMSSLVAWRLGIQARDRLEFEQFLRSAREDNEELLNECYKSPTQTTHNPMFGKLSFRNRSFR